MPQTIEYLQQKIDRELAWRKKELVGIMRGASRASASKVYYCRAGAVMLCAHWEGFLKKAVELYVDFVFSQELSFREMSCNFVAIAFYSDVVEAAKSSFPGSERHHLRLARKIRDAASGPARWEVTTRSNPSSEVLRELLSSIGIDSELGMGVSEWARTRTFIDALLLGERHKIAHGEGLRIDGDVLRERFGLMLDLCQSLANAILSAAEGGTYQAELSQ
ncbi:hypothetical protein FHT03_000725 [Xanthomonas arboricola]